MSDWKLSWRQASNLDVSTWSRCFAYVLLLVGCMFAATAFAYEEDLSMGGFAPAGFILGLLLLLYCAFGWRVYLHQCDGGLIKAKLRHRVFGAGLTACEHLRDEARVTVCIRGVFGLGTSDWYLPGVSDKSCRIWVSHLEELDDERYELWLCCQNLGSGRTLRLRLSTVMQTPAECRELLLAEGEQLFKARRMK